MPDRESMKPGTWLPGPTFPKMPMDCNLAPRMPQRAYCRTVACCARSVQSTEWLSTITDPLLFLNTIQAPPTPMRLPGTRYNPATTTGHPQPAYFYCCLLRKCCSSTVLITSGSTHRMLNQTRNGRRPSLPSPIELELGGTYTLQGTQLNGLSQACSYGDDAAMATNFPLVRLSSKSLKSVHYCRTFGHSTMGVATGQTTIVTTNFKIPIDLPAGDYQLSVVANRNRVGRGRRQSR